MLTVDFDRLGIGPSVKVIDVGCGAGRHAFEAYRRGAEVVAFDRDASELRSVDTILHAMAETGEAPAAVSAKVVLGDALSLPYADETFDCVIASEILEHIPQDDAAIAELIRVLKVGGTLAVSVPRWLPERLCWLLSDEYHSNEGGHVRIYRASELREKIIGGGMPVGAFGGRRGSDIRRASSWTPPCRNPGQTPILGNGRDISPRNQGVIRVPLPRMRLVRPGLSTIQVRRASTSCRRRRRPPRSRRSPTTR